MSNGRADFGDIGPYEPERVNSQRCDGWVCTGNWGLVRSLAGWFGNVRQVRYGESGSLPLLE